MVNATLATSLTHTDQSRPLMEGLGLVWSHVFQPDRQLKSKFLNALLKPMDDACCLASGTAARVRGGAAGAGAGAASTGCTSAGLCGCGCEAAATTCTTPVAAVGPAPAVLPGLRGGGAALHAHGRAAGGAAATQRHPQPPSGGRAGPLPGAAAAGGRAAVAGACGGVCVRVCLCVCVLAGEGTRCCLAWGPPAEEHWAWREPLDGFTTDTPI